MNSLVEFSSEMGVELIMAPVPEWIAAHAARVSTGRSVLTSERDAARDDGLMRRLLADGHMTPFEYLDITFKLDIPIFVHNQLVKHRISTINTQSGRYREFEPKFYLPPTERPLFQEGKAMDYKFLADAQVSGGEEMRHAFTEAVMEYNEHWYEGYRNMLCDGIAREVARMTMPLNTYTTCWVKMNMRSWLHFLGLRLYDPDTGFISHAQWEIDQVARKVAQCLQQRYPVILEKFYEIQKNMGER